MSAHELITDHLDLWTQAVTRKSTAGRGGASGKSGKIELTGIKKLRELILELAVRGKLVEQDPGDEPASMLLEQVANEKAQLAKVGKIKKSKKLPDIDEEEKPFCLPDGWLWTRMEAISEYIQRGKGPKYAETGGVRVVSQKCVQWSGFDLSVSRFVDDSSLDGYQDERYIRDGDVLWNSTGTGTVGRAIVIKKPQYSIVADSHVTIVRLLIAEPSYVLNYISSPSVQHRIEPGHENSLVSGTTKQVELNSGSVKLLPVPLPPLKEQHRIVQKVDELMALCDQLERHTSNQLDAHETLVDTLLGTLTQSANATELADNWARLAEHFDTLFTTEKSIDKLKQTILQLAVMGRLVEQKHGKMDTNSLLHEITLCKKRLIDEGKLKKQKTLPAIADEEKTIPIPASWEWVRLQDVIDVRDGTHDSPKNATGPDTYPLVTSKDFSDGQIDFSNAKRISEEDHRLISQRSLVEPEDILFSMIGGNIGNQVLVNTSEKFSVKNVALFKYYDKTLTLPRFLKIFTEDLANSLQDQASGGAQPFVSLGKLRNLPFPIAPVEEQHRIVQKVDELMAFCDHLKQRLNEASNTRCQLAGAVVEGALN